MTNLSCVGIIPARFPRTRLPGKPLAGIAGKTLIQQHRMVYAALGERLKREEIHALSLKTGTPDAGEFPQS